MEGGDNELSIFPRSHLPSSELEIRTQNDGFGGRGDINDARGDPNIKFHLELGNPVHMVKVLQ